MSLDLTIIILLCINIPILPLIMAYLMPHIVESIVDTRTSRRRIRLAKKSSTRQAKNHWLPSNIPQVDKAKFAKRLLQENNYNHRQHHQ